MQWVTRNVEMPANLRSSNSARRVSVPEILLERSLLILQLGFFLLLCMLRKLMRKQVEFENLNLKIKVYRTSWRASSSDAHGNIEIIHGRERFLMQKKTRKLRWEDRKRDVEFTPDQAKGNSRQSWSHVCNLSGYLCHCGYQWRCINVRLMWICWTP